MTPPRPLTERLQELLGGKGRGRANHYDGEREVVAWVVVEPLLREALARIEDLDAEREVNYQSWHIADARAEFVGQQLATLSREREELREALRQIKSQCAGHADEFSGSVWRIADAALSRPPASKPEPEERG